MYMRQHSTTSTGGRCQPHNVVAVLFVVVLVVVGVVGINVVVLIVLVVAVVVSMIVDLAVAIAEVRCVCVFVLKCCSQVLNMLF